MVPMKEILLRSGLDPASFRTYWKALCLLPDCLVKSCGPDVVIDGYKKSGILPIDNNAIMSGWSRWSKLKSTVAVEVLQKIPVLALLAKKGRLSIPKSKENLATSLNLTIALVNRTTAPSITDAVSG